MRATQRSTMSSASHPFSSMEGSGSSATPSTAELDLALSKARLGTDLESGSSEEQQREFITCPGSARTSHGSTLAQQDSTKSSHLHSSRMHLLRKIQSQHTLLNVQEPTVVRNRINVETPVAPGTSYAKVPKRAQSLNNLPCSSQQDQPPHRDPTNHWLHSSPSPSPLSTQHSNNTTFYSGNLKAAAARNGLDSHDTSIQAQLLNSVEPIFSRSPKNLIPESGRERPPKLSQSCYFPDLADPSFPQDRWELAVILKLLETAERLVLEEQAHSFRPEQIRSDHDLLCPRPFSPWLTKEKFKEGPCPSPRTVLTDLANHGQDNVRSMANSSENELQPNSGDSQRGLEAPSPTNVTSLTLPPWRQGTGLRPLARSRCIRRAHRQPCADHSLLDLSKVDSGEKTSQSPDKQKSKDGPREDNDADTLVETKIGTALSTKELNRETPHLLSTVLVSGDLVAGSGVGAKQDALQSTLITDTSHVSETTLSPRHHLREPIGLGFPSTLRKSFFEDYNYRSPLWQYRSRQQTSRRRRSNETAMIFGHSRTAQAGSVGRTPRMDLMSHVQRSQLYAPVSLSSITKHQRSDPISGSLEKERHSSPQEIIPVSKLIEQAAEISSFCHHVASGELGPASPTFGFCSTNTPRPSSMSALITGDYNYKKRPSSFASKPPTTPTSALFFAPRTNRKSRPGGLTNSLRDDTTISSPLASPGAAFLRQTDIPASQKSPILWSRPMQYLKRKSEALQHFVNQQPSTTPPPDQMAAQKGSTRGCRTVPITAGSFHSKANSNTPMSISLPIVSLEEREKLIRVITEDYSQDSSQVCPPVQTNIYSNAIDDLDDPWFTPKKDPFTTERGMYSQVYLGLGPTSPGAAGCPNGPTSLDDHNKILVAAIEQLDHFERAPILLSNTLYDDIYPYSLSSPPSPSTTPSPASSINSPKVRRKKSLHEFLFGRKPKRSVDQSTLENDGSSDASSLGCNDDPIPSGSTTPTSYHSVAQESPRVWVNDPVFYSEGNDPPHQSPELGYDGLQVPRWFMAEPESFLQDAKTMNSRSPSSELCSNNVSSTSSASASSSKSARQRSRSTPSPLGQFSYLRRQPFG